MCFFRGGDGPPARKATPRRAGPKQAQNPPPRARVKRARALAARAAQGSNAQARLRIGLLTNRKRTVLGIKRKGGEIHAAACPHDFWDGHED